MGSAYGKKFREEHRGTFVPCVDGFRILVKPLFHLPREGEGKQTKLDACWCDVFYGDAVTQLKEVLQMSTCILARRSTELVCLHHHD
jgi:hypothetical protein